MVLSSSAMVTAAETVQDAGDLCIVLKELKRKKSVPSLRDSGYFLRAPGTAVLGFPVPSLHRLFHPGSSELRMG